MKKSLESKKFMERAEKFKHFLEDNGVECLHIDSVAGRLTVIEQGVLRVRDEWWEKRIREAIDCNQISFYGKAENVFKLLNTKE